jgi:hypothetical protein
VTAEDKTKEFDEKDVAEKSGLPVFAAVAC